jgi:CubicO group peptidase (beta-lactamase class C family)
MHTQVFEPLRMHDTIPDSATAFAGDRPVEYFPRYAADPRYGLHGIGDIDYSCYAGASVFRSTPSDLVRFGLGIIGGTLLRTGTVHLLQTSQRLASGEETAYGLGWDLETVDLAGTPSRVVGHDGTMAGGMVASLLIVPEHGLVVAVTANIAYADTFTLGVGIARAFVDAPGGPRVK